VNQKLMKGKIDVLQNAFSIQYFYCVDDNFVGIEFDTCLSNSSGTVGGHNRC